MVDLLRRSVGRREPPICPHCHVPMSWYRSMPPRGQPGSGTVVHYFQCPNCNGIAEIAAPQTGM